LAIGSYIEQYSNSVSIIKKYPNDNDDTNDDIIGSTGQPQSSLYKAGEFDHPYPCTKIIWSPDTNTTTTRNRTSISSSSHQTRDLLATTGDYLRIWNIIDDGMGRGTVKCVKECLLNNNKTSEYCAPLTSFDWNETDTNIIGTSSIDTTCTIWDIETQTARTQLIAHDREVFDLAFARGKDVFASVGADGSVRMFDLRSLEHSTIIFESPAPKFDPLLRLEWNKQDPNYLATFMVDRCVQHITFKIVFSYYILINVFKIFLTFIVKSRRTIILDIRVPSIPVAELGGHSGCVNAAGTFSDRLLDYKSLCKLFHLLTFFFKLIRRQHGHPILHVIYVQPVRISKH
jgi:DDB1- and CUL4-associated factor 7